MVSNIDMTAATATATTSTTGSPRLVTKGRGNTSKSGKGSDHRLSSASISRAGQIVLILGNYGPMTVPQLTAWLAAADPS